MPRISLHVRNEDWEAFQAIPDRPKWLHKAIQATVTGDKSPSLPEPVIVAEEAMLTCTECQKRDVTVKARTCEYDLQVFDRLRQELVCDACEERHIASI